MKRLLLCMPLVCIAVHAAVDPLERLWQDYDGEWGHVSRQLVALAEAIPADKYSWRPARVCDPRGRRYDEPNAALGDL